MTKDEKKKFCAGCRDNYYNGIGAKECWNLKSGKVVTRYRIGWWTMQDRAENFQEVTTLSCHSAPGQYAMLPKIPEHLRAEWNQRKKAAKDPPSVPPGEGAA